MEKKTKALKPEFLLLITGINDNDNTVEGLAGGMYTVHHKLTYVPPYEKFSGLRKLQLKLRNSPAAMGRRVCAAIDLGEWVGHENDEYFIASVKFFHDKCKRISFVFTVGNKTAEQVKTLRQTLRLYMRGELREDNTFIDITCLAKYIESRAVEKRTSELIAEMLMRDEMRQLMSYPAVNRLCYEMRSTSASGIVKAEDMSAYLRDTESMPYITDSKVSFEYATKADEVAEKTFGEDSAA